MSNRAKDYCTYAPIGRPSPTHTFGKAPAGKALMNGGGCWQVCDALGSAVSLFAWMTMCILFFFRDHLSILHLSVFGTDFDFCCTSLVSTTMCVAQHVLDMDDFFFFFLPQQVA